MNLKLILLFLFSSALLNAEDWPRWLGPEGTGVSTESGWKNNLEEQAWKSKVGVGFSSRFGSRWTRLHHGPRREKSDGKETVYCLDAETGKWFGLTPTQLLDRLLA